ncbi:hypothetical protein I6H58_10280 [Rothia kristinae]|uniref:LysM domain-containing protein n=1 Tax=Rothia kristinae TaxID=37923 RepID=A0A7T4MTI3_9MICC|nr:hypothetical protein [Rothia kristinae]QQC59308.1 hypothetical protein I6H58_10280 [Rothia kristinae]
MIIMERLQGSGPRGFWRVGTLLCLFGAIAVASSAGLVSLLGSLSWAELTSPAADPERLLVRFLLLAALGLVLWWSCGAAVLAVRSVLARDPGSPRLRPAHHRLPRPVALPGPVYRVVLLALGINAALLPAAHAQQNEASPSPTPQPSGAAETSASADPVETPDGETSAPSTSADAAAQTAADAPASTPSEGPETQLRPLFPATAAILPASQAERLAAPSTASPVAVREAAELTPLFGAARADTQSSSTDVESPADQPRQNPSSRAAADDALPASNPSTAGEASTWVVLRGHTLWQIAATCTGDQDDARTARAVQRIYAANEDILRDGPDFLLPGMVLTIPPEVAD